MKSILVVCLLSVLLVGCGQQKSGPGEQTAQTREVLLDVQAPEPLPIPEPMQVKSNEDWEAKVHNKNIEVLQVINIVNPVAAYITAGFKKYGDKFSPTLKEEWTDTQAQLTQALTLYDDCKKRMEKKQYDKQLFLDLEGVWQILVKTGVAGVRTQSMVQAEIKRLTG